VVTLLRAWGGRERVPCAARAPRSVLPFSLLSLLSSFRRNKRNILYEPLPGLTFFRYVSRYVFRSPAVTARLDVTAAASSVACASSHARRTITTRLVPPPIRRGSTRSRGSRPSRL